MIPQKSLGTWKIASIGGIRLGALEVIKECPRTNKIKNRIGLRHQYTFFNPAILS
jgi:hypothetical protein